MEIYGWLVRGSGASRLCCERPGILGNVLTIPRNFLLSRPEFRSFCKRQYCISSAKTPKFLNDNIGRNDFVPVAAILDAYLLFLYNC
jgi:hypothetical protein